MFLLRNVVDSDLEDLFELSSLEVFINLPNNKESLKRQIQSSIKSFSDPSDVKSDNYYIFVVEDLEKKKVVGVSMIHGQHGTDEEPHFYLKVDKIEKFSTTINTGFIHGTLQLEFEPNGYTEIGGLVLHPDYRGHPEKIGKQISFVRFLYLATNKEKFTDLIHAELLPPLNKKGNPILWDAIGKIFTNMNYTEADKLSRTNKEFILSLFPNEKIYKSLLPVEARDAIGKVGQKTEPVKKMLESVGFLYMNEVDPFDGGPHYRAHIDQIKPVEATKILEVKNGDHNKSNNFIIQLQSDKYDFNAVLVSGEVRGSELLTSFDFSSLGINDNFKTWVTPV